jgi:diaminopimelate decarboxylase/aspartate/methionine/tyrosine aminotransferase
LALLNQTRERFASQALPTPALVYFERILAAAVAHLLELTDPIPGRICLYSAKAATFPFLLRTLHRHGIAGFDASSPTEAALVARVFGSRVPLYVTAPGIVEPDFERLESIAPACIHVDSLASLAAGLAHPQLHLGVRINPGITYARVDLHAAGGPRSRLGLPLAQLADALALFRRAGRRSLGLHLHTTCEAPDFGHHARGVELLAELLETGVAEGLTITHLDVGGGLRPPIWNFEDDRLEPQVDVDSRASLLDALARLRDRHAKLLAPDFRVVFEPGDFLVCAAAIMLSRVVEARTDGAGREHLLLDTNINHFPNVLHYGNTPRVLVPAAQADAARTVQLSGNSCLGGDHIASVALREHELPREVVFDERGSYEYTQYNFFNGRLRPSVWLLDLADELIPCKIDRLDDLIEYWREQVPVFPEPYQSFHHFESIARAERGLHLYHPNMRMVSSFEFDPREFPAPLGLREALLDGFDRGAPIYGRSLGIEPIRERIAEFENQSIGKPGFYDREAVACTLGATNAIWLTLEATLAGGLRRLLIPCPTYYQFASTCSKRGIPWTAVHQREACQLQPEDAGKPIDARRLVPSLADMLAAIDAAPDIGALALVNPGLPLGNYYDDADVHALADRARELGFVLILDETLAGIAHNRVGTDLTWLEPTHPVIRIASISKTFGLPGLRLGYLTVSPAATRRFDNGEDVLERMAVAADTAYSAPPAALEPVLRVGLDIQTRWRALEREHPDPSRYASNLARLRARAERGAALLAAAKIPHVLPEAGASLSACLTKLPDCRRDAEPFFRAVLHQHDMFLETGGHFSQNPRWNFTLARLGLARADADFELDLERVCRSYSNFSLPR